MNLDDIFKQDQDNEAIRGSGRLLGAYYRGLIDAGIPEDVAGEMILDYHWATFCCSRYIETGHFPPRS